MTPGEMEWIKREIRNQVQIILAGNTAATQIDDRVGTESIDNCPPGNPTINARPLAHPYGLVSRAPKGTAQVVARQGEHPANKLVLLHRDKDRPSLSAEGEVMLYDKFGNQIWMKDGDIVVKLDGNMHLGDGATKEAARKGDTVNVGTLSLTVAGSATISGTYTAPSGATTPVVPGTPFAISGEINSGSSKVKIID